MENYIRDDDRMIFSRFPFFNRRRPDSSLWTVPPVYTDDEYEKQDMEFCIRLAIEAENNPDDESYTLEEAARMLGVDLNAL